jgi:hypothetical protein
MGGPEEHEGISPTQRGPPIPSWPTPRACPGIKARAGRAFRGQPSEEGIPEIRRPISQGGLPTRALQSSDAHLHFLYFGYAPKKRVLRKQRKKKVVG